MASAPDRPASSSSTPTGPGADKAATFDADEAAKFEASAESWWDATGPFAPLHRINPLRLTFIRDEFCRKSGRDPRQINVLDGLNILDIGCGGGLLAEALARMGGKVVAIDPGARTIDTARAHARESGLAIDYRVGDLDTAVKEGEVFDLITAMEVIEHVPDPGTFIAAASRHLEPRGGLALATLNRTALSYGLAIIAAERLLKWVPKGTHDWRKFITPQELSFLLEKAGLETTSLKGIIFDPLGGGWRLSRRVRVNYLLFAEK